MFFCLYSLKKVHFIFRAKATELVIFLYFFLNFDQMTFGREQK